jgi:hypothetical protein
VRLPRWWRYRVSTRAQTRLKASAPAPGNASSAALEATGRANPPRRPKRRYSRNEKDTGQRHTDPPPAPRCPTDLHYNEEIDRHILKKIDLSANSETDPMARAAAKSIPKCARRVRFMPMPTSIAT